MAVVVERPLACYAARYRGQTRLPLKAGSSKPNLALAWTAEGSIRLRAYRM